MLLAQRQTRQSQHALLAQQTFVVHALADRRDPYAAYTASRRALAAHGDDDEDDSGERNDEARLPDAGLVAMCKDRWNAEIAGAVRRVEGWSWGAVWASVAAARRDAGRAE